MNTDNKTTRTLSAADVIASAVAGHQRGRRVVLCTCGLDARDAFVVLGFGLAWARWQRVPCVDGVSS